MFVTNINNNLCFCFYFLLATNIITVATHPTHSLTSCNCILLQACEAFSKFIDNSSDENHIKTVIQDAVCFFDGFSILVCCPDKFEQVRMPLLDYIDESTGLNCPPSFGGQYNYDEYLKAHEVEPKHIHYFEKSKINNTDISVKFYDHSTECDELSTPSRSHNYHHHQHHHHHPNHHYNHHHHHHQKQAPFFPQTHKKHNFHDNSIEKSTTRPEKNESKSCGILDRVSQSSVQVYPWIIRLAYLNTTSRTIRYRCMGTIISDEHILTAAHCVDKLVPDLRLIYVRVGDDADFEDYQILETIVHPKYNEPLFNNDVAILKIAVTSQRRGTLTQICLPTNTSTALSGNTGVVAGWSSSGLADIKNSAIRYINLPIMNNTECAIRYAKYSENFETSIVITPTEFCAKAETMNDVCEGDSGGPFMERSDLGRYTLLGIVAFGPKTNCGQSNLPGVYMRVSSYVDWIKRSIQ